MARHLYNKIEQQQAPAFFVRGPSPFARLAFFSVLSLALMASDSRLQYLASMRQSLQTLLHPLQLLANAPAQLYLNTTEYFSTHDTLLSENEQLKKRDLMQSIALQKLNLLALENAHMRELLAAQTALKESSVAAEIMHVGRDPFTRKILINRGQNHKILPGMAVVDAAGVIGQVTRVYPLSSEVTLITDTSLAMPVQIERNGLRAIAFGHGRDSTVDLPYLPANVDIQRGDRLVTSGIDGVYPAGLAVATVKQIVSAAETPFARIVCEPAGGVENHRQVLVVSKPELAGISKPSLTQPVKLGLNPATPADKKQSMPNKSAKPRDAHAR
jgi:rod shape-determining protein MreC